MAGCDEDYLRTEIVLARWVRDSADADVHVMITAQHSASATEYELVFLGKKRFSSRNDTMQFVAPRTHTADFDLAHDRGFSSHSHHVTLNALLARALGDQWSVAINGSLTSSTRLNRNLALALAPAIEYSLLPYPEFTRRRLVLRYTAGVEMVDYEQETIYDHTRQHLYSQSLVGTVAYNQPWNSARPGLNAPMNPSRTPHLFRYEWQNHEHRVAFPVV